MPKPKPAFIVLDTNVLLRFLILDYGTKEKIGLPELANAADISITLSPHQEDEFWRNASNVYYEHDTKWKSIVRDSKKYFQDLMSNLRSSDALGVLTEKHRKFLEESTAFQKEIDTLEESQASWLEFAEFAESNLEIIRNQSTHLDEYKETIWEKAKARVELSNPPCSEKKKRPLGDCLVWETVMQLLQQRQGPVWFASTDSDFCDKSDTKKLNYYLEREAKKVDGKLEFFYEDRSLAFNPGTSFSILTNLTESIPEHVTETMLKAIHAFSSISPNVSWSQLVEAMDKLNYREREILKLRFGWDLSGYDYTQTEVARIFKLSQPRVSQIQRKALRKLGNALSEELDEEE